eukprot:CAMPEP_0195034418 /NCGR_PEP_ID=MMETSP0326_2-20130528/67823_1 /TAXON_ID=2866 ORGANISM="Crypthecodinium cohnii, Strain Seligo" /NCGR_SAMPLE_ID=MMETSP0326_2 /ASSEMBLY_ACC=CAM_ASM_000348 /LENGTH=109 /DNA_ID=CAMNT_0040059243 /DNA_START=71 /DNA_END=401 /DNA_ORIENTATION=-
MEERRDVAASWLTFSSALPLVPRLTLLSSLTLHLGRRENEALDEHRLSGHHRMRSHWEDLVLAREELVHANLHEVAAGAELALLRGQGLEVLAVHDYSATRTKMLQTHF